MTESGRSYSAEFYDAVSEAAAHAAQFTIPVILNAVRPRSVVDVGCGAGTWARAFADAGVPDVVGVDGDWVDTKALLIPSDQFIRADLTRPFRLPRQFDLCLSLEVAEHLSPDRAAGFVADLTALSDVVVFSAAIPFQGGTHHLNEQWQAYWVEQFAAQGYVGVDYLRRRIWNLNRFNTWYYAQNAILFVRASALAEHPALAEEYRYQGGPPVSLVHPGLLVLLAPWEKRLSVRRYIGLFPRMAARAAAALASWLTARPTSLNNILPPGTNEWHKDKR